MGGLSLTCMFCYTATNELLFESDIHVEIWYDLFLYFYFNYMEALLLPSESPRKAVPLPVILLSLYTCTCKCTPSSCRGCRFPPRWSHNLIPHLIEIRLCELQSRPITRLFPSYLILSNRYNFSTRAPPPAKPPTMTTPPPPDASIDGIPPLSLYIYIYLSLSPLSSPLHPQLTPSHGTSPKVHRVLEQRRSHSKWYPLPHPTLVPCS